MGRKIMKRLLFNKKIYKKRALIETIAVFKEYLHCFLKSEGNYFQVIVSGKNISSRDIDEFVNYALGATKKCL